MRLRPGLKMAESNAWAFSDPLHLLVPSLQMFRLRGEGGVAENRWHCSKLKEKWDVVALCSTCLFSKFVLHFYSLT